MRIVLPWLRRASTGSGYPPKKEQRKCPDAHIASEPSSGSPARSRIAAAATGRAAPTAPPPVTILTHGNVGHGDFFVSPFGDQSTYANGPEILDQHGNVVWFQPVPAGQEASDFRTQTYQRPAGADLVAGHRPRRPRQRHRLHLQRPLPADRHGQRRQRPQRRRPRVPDHAAEHGADPRLHDRRPPTSPRSAARRTRP